MSTGQASIVLGGGCFWCLEAVFQALPGVKQVTSGYAGGDPARANYQAVCDGDTGHAEVVELIYDPALLSLARLLDVFFAIHDPTTRNRQGHDVGSQYRSVVFYQSEEQRLAALAAMQAWAESHPDANPVVTELTPLPEFFPAEREHHNYFALHPGQGYCRMVVAPKVAKFRQTFLSQ